jgi:hypothetical protein
MHPYNNGRRALDGCLPCAGLGARAEPPWYKNPMLILVGVAVLMYATSTTR